jgi:hypothetical protein
MQLSSAIPTSAYIGLASSTPAADELAAARQLVSSIFDMLQSPGTQASPVDDVPVRSARTWSSIPLILASSKVCIKRKTSGAVENLPGDMYFGPEEKKEEEHDALRLDCSAGADPWEAREPVAGAGAVRLIRNFQSMRSRPQPRELPMVPIAPLRPQSALDNPFIQETAEFISKATRIIVLCVNQAMEERIIQCRYERFLQRSINRVSTFIPNSNRIANAYKKSNAAKAASSSSFAYRGSLLGTIRGQIAARQSSPNSKNPLESFELQPNFEKGKDAESRRYQDNAFLPNWRKRTYAKPQSAQEWEQSEETKRLSLIKPSRQSSFLTSSRRQADIAMPAVPLWDRNNWKKSV